MKKILLFVLMVLVGISFVTASFADEARTITKKSKGVTATGSISAQGAVLYKVTGYASANSAVYGLYNATTYAASTSTAVKVEGGEATQYDSLPTLDFGDEGLVFDTGIYAVISNAYVIVEYI